MPFGLSIQKRKFTRTFAVSLVAAHYSHPVQGVSWEGGWLSRTMGRFIPRVALQLTGLMLLHIPLIVAAPSTLVVHHSHVQLSTVRAILLVSVGAHCISPSCLNETQAGTLMFLSVHRQGRSATPRMIRCFSSGFRPCLTHCRHLYLSASCRWCTARTNTAIPVWWRPTPHPWSCHYRSTRTTLSRLNPSAREGKAAAAARLPSPR